MTEQTSDLKELHWMMGMLHSINVGLIVIDRDYKVQLWNSFMVNHSGMRADVVVGKPLLEIFQDIPRRWFERKIESVLTIENRSFTTWEQRPYLFPFKNFRPITGASDYMYQNITFLPLLAVNNTVSHIGIIIYDVTDSAVSQQELEKANDELERLSRTDRLTELYNRGYWEECLHNEYQRLCRTGHNSTLLMFDIDHFKNINDTYGHQAGDEVIRTTARTLRRTIRRTDISGRYGGEEFTVILLDTAPESAMILCERLRKRIEALAVAYDDQKISFTISIGIAGYQAGLADYQQWLERADQALYYCKKHGRNQCAAYENISNTDVGSSSANSR